MLSEQELSFLVSYLLRNPEKPQPKENGSNELEASSRRSSYGALHQIFQDCIRIKKPKAITKGF
jgi:hypothetical protein